MLAEMLTLKLTFLYIPKIYTQMTQYLLAPLLIANKCRTNIIIRSSNLIARREIWDKSRDILQN